MKRETQNILLILLGGALLKITVNGDYLRYVKPAQQPWIIAGGAVMVALGAVAIVRDLLSARAAAAVPGEIHEHNARSAWLLMVPVLAVFLVAPPALGADSVTRTEARAPQSAAASNAAAFPPLPAGDVVPLEVNEFVSRAGWDSSGSLNGRTVRLSGFVVHNEGNTMLARMVIGCCAADAFPITVRMVGEGVSGFGNDTWLEVTGTVVPGTAVRENSYMPDLTLTSVRQVPAPKDPYEY
ncbi:TIGR03943 family putative permease subunit [Amycolatopsis keratiniphila]|uniref:TIGR03943 family protein n=1 Tax=Amycolatopsis keratiniphila subsp. keratiniphila TaxID=227715 RepID=A0A1W2LQQ0_9PSEU|nr:TIGR03943 family protein [Amycolatopsis keratiniphila]OLZ46802.1 TIGR03943 family protein [Amycolatopsis keratiniphila subsp. nogabecina]ONF66274.1 TIGR03943 family protein [Amycolatopsis keratiniphila subsp. keratiniphila]SDU39587.1 TIGR03943 family protein [Amycolatopsis keratiniphila]